jgi:preprotein translocase subunit SecA
MRKRLLEYDDVMNKQRTVVYKRRKNALLGDRLALDIQNMISDWCDDKIHVAKQADDYEALSLEMALSFALELPFDIDEFKSGKVDELGDQLYHYLIESYQQRQHKVKEVALPVLKKIQTTEGDKVEFVMIPFSDGIKNFGIPINLKKCIQTDGDALTVEYEKNVCLETLDDEWKDHLRELDDLKQSANNATFEQKDPLLIYKIESVKLFQSMIGRMNDKILSMLFKAQIAAEDNRGVQKAKEPAKTDLSKMRLSSSDTNIPSPNPIENMMGNADAEDRGGMSRAERRKIERESQKKR